MVLDMVKLNIERFRRLLSETTDAAKRKVIEKLLAEEEAKQPRERPGAERGNSPVSPQK